MGSMAVEGRDFQCTYYVSDGYTPFGQNGQILLFTEIYIEISTIFLKLEFAM